MKFMMNPKKTVQPELWADTAFWRLGHSEKKGVLLPATNTLNKYAKRKKLDFKFMVSTNNYF